MERQSKFVEDFTSQDDEEMQWESVAGMVDEPDRQGECLPDFSYLSPVGPWGSLDDELEVARLRLHSPVFALGDAKVDFDVWSGGMVEYL
jgi:hypothetical protein